MLLVPRQLLKALTGSNGHRMWHVNTAANISALLCHLGAKINRAIIQFVAPLVGRSSIPPTRRLLSVSSHQTFASPRRHRKSALTHTSSQTEHMITKHLRWAPMVKSCDSARPVDQSTTSRLVTFTVQLVVMP